MSNTYSFQDVSANIAGPTGSIDLGYGAGIAKEGITIEPSAETNTMTIGADGTPMHSLHADKSGNVVVRVLKTSPLNALLQAMYDAQRLSARLWGQNIIVVRQTQSGDITTCDFCAFKKNPSIEYKEDADMIEWRWDVGRIDKVLGTY